MPEKFEVTLVGNDQLGGMLERNIEKVSELAASAQKANASMGKEGSQDAQSNLTLLEKKFSAISDVAKKNVQHLGDMVPPLKNIGALVGPLGKLGIAGGAVYGVSRIASSMGDMARHAYSMDNSAKNIGLSAEKLSMVYGAFRLAGVDEQAASQSLVTVADTFNDILRGGENGNRVMSQLEAMGLSRDMIPVQYDAYGNQTVIVDKLLPVLDSIYDSIQSPQIRHEFARATGIDDSLEALLRGDRSVQDRYQQAYDIGLVTLEETNKRLNELNSNLTQTSASISGWWNRTKNDAADWILSDGSVMNGITGVGDVFNHGDRAAWQMAAGINLDDDSAMWRTMQGDSQYDQFKSTLGWWNRFQLGSGVMPEGVWDEFVDFKQQSNPDYKDPFAGRIGPNTLVRGTPIGEDDTSSTAASMNGVSSIAASISQADENIKKFLDLIAMSEGTFGKGDDGYNVTFGGGLFNNGFAYHPNIQRPFRQTDGNWSSSGAAGRYQFLNSTWGDLSKQLGLTDFGKESQDKAAIELIRRAGALEDVKAGNWMGAVGKLGNIWASFPSSPYPQGSHSYGQMGQFWGQINQSRPLADDIAQAINQKPAQVNINISNGRDTQTVSVRTGGTVTTSMAF
ncbi:glycoside hydrolase family 24 protein [Saezia sanguinis]|uniref:glycoside hydrolase family 24 protein n=1 Tax=Saezia sanguinis TaxID=1965230 RepID=UPI003022D89B